VKPSVKQRAAIKAIKEFRKSNKSWDAQIDFYYQLTDAGLTQAEADEMTDLEIDFPD
jgi:hypothetical protein